MCNGLFVWFHMSGFTVFGISFGRRPSLRAFELFLYDVGPCCRGWLRLGSSAVFPKHQSCGSCVLAVSQKERVTFSAEEPNKVEISWIGPIENYNAYLWPYDLVMFWRSKYL